MVAKVFRLVAIVFWIIASMLIRFFCLVAKVLISRSKGVLSNNGNMQLLGCFG